jgi:hypothetical protein
VAEELVTSADVFHIALRELGLDSGAPLGPHDDGVVGEWYSLERQPTGEELADKQLDRDLLAWVEDSRKVIVSSTGAVEAYDLARDPGELTPIPLTEGELEAARERARQWWEGHPPPAPVTLTSSEDQLERLRGLGYVGGDG